MSDQRYTAVPESKVTLGEVFKHTSGRRYRVTHITNAGSKIDGVWRYENYISYSLLAEPFREYGRFESDFLTSMVKL